MAALPFCRVRLRAEKPRSTAYPREPKTLGDHLRKRRLDLGLLQKDVATEIGVDLKTLCNWERQRTEPEIRFLPAIFRFLGTDPRPLRVTFPERLRAARTALGLSQKALAWRLRIDPGTVARWEAGRGRPRGRFSKLLAEGLGACMKG